MTVPSQARPDGFPLTDTTELTTPLGRARWILATDARGTQAEVDAFDALLAEVRRNRERDEALRKAAVFEDEHGGCQCRTCQAALASVPEGEPTT